MSGKILNAELRTLVGKPVFALGEAYAKEGLVRFVELENAAALMAASAADNKAVVLLGEVGGRGVAPYQQRVTLKWGGKGKLQLVGNCSCPVRFNCKHVVAVCLVAKKHWRGQWSRAGIAPRWELNRTASSAPMLPEAGQSGAESAASPTEALGMEIAYLLKPAIDAQSVAVSVVAVDHRDSPPSQRAVKLDAVQNPYFRPAFATERDSEITRQLLGAQLCSTAYLLDPHIQAHCLLQGSAGALALRSMVQSGRAFWQPQAGLPDDWAAARVQAGQPRKLDIYWREAEQQDGQAGDLLQLALRVTAPKAASEAIENTLWVLTEPALYVAHSSGQVSIGELDTLGLQPAHLRQLSDVPPMPLARAEQFGAELQRRHQDIGLVPPRQLKTVAIEGVTPLPRLCLNRLPASLLAENVGEQADFVRFGVRLQFIYRDAVLDPGDGRPRSLVETGEVLLAVQRDLAAEETVAAALAAQGLQVWRDAHGASWWAMPQTETLAYSGEQQVVSRQQQITQWAALLEDFLPEVEASGWEVVREADFSLSFYKADTWWGAVEETSHDWFDLRLDVEIQGQRVSLLKLLLPVLDEFTPQNLPETLYLPLDDDRYFPVLAEEIRPFLQTLYELYDFVSPDTERLRLSRYDARVLAELAAANTAQTLSRRQAVLRWQGGETLQALGDRLQDFQGIRHCPLPVGFHGELRDYQQQGLNWLQFLREYDFNGVLADDMGLGKTVQTIAHMLVEKNAGRLGAAIGNQENTMGTALSEEGGGACCALVVAPTSLMGNWRREIAQFAPGLSVLVLQGQDRHHKFAEMRAADVLLTTYPLLPRDEEALASLDYHLLVLDEAQMIKNPKSKAALAARRLNARHRLCLTGTPMENHLGELWAHFDLLMPGFLGDSKTFKKSYQTPIEKHGDRERQQALSRRVAPFMLRRKKDEVERELPPKTEMIRSVPLGRAQAALYETIRIAMESRVRASIASKGLARSHITILDALLKLRQTCCDPRLLKLEQAKAVKESAKLDMLMEMLPELLDEGRRVLVFSQFVSMLRLIEAELDAAKIAYVSLTGETKKRDEVIERFNAGESDVFLISLKAGGVGLNLTRADTVILYDPWWNPAVEAQAMDRTHRIGQDKPVFVYKLLTERTVEEKILALQESKKALAEGVYQAAGGGKQADLSSTLSSEVLTEILGEAVQDAA